MAVKRSRRRRRRRRNRGLTLPAELIDEILVLLPLKSIIRFETVSKEWKSNIHSTSFKEFHWQRTKNKNESELKTMKLEDLYKMAPQLRQISSDGVKHRTKISVVGPSSSGIYCLTSILVHDSILVEDSIPSECSIELWGCKIALCNPGIRRFKFLPPFPMRFRPELTQASRGFNRVVSGFDGTSCCFRVVVVIGYGESREDGFDSFLVFVYSSNSGKWEKLVDYEPEKEPVGPPVATRAFTKRIFGHIVGPSEVCSQKLLNGCWHWMVHEFEGTNPVVLSFNFAHQSFSLIEVPEPGPTSSFTSNDDVFVLFNHLTVIKGSWNMLNWDLVFSIWMMMDYGVEESWTLKFKACMGVENFTWGGLYRLNQLMDCLDLQVDAEEEGGFDGVFIKKLFFTCIDVGYEDKIISLDRHGGHQVTPLPYNPNSEIIFSIGGVSSYKETLEHLH